jgi:hypothetical protein
MKKLGLMIFVLGLFIASQSCTDRQSYENTYKFQDIGGFRL